MRQQGLLALLRLSLLCCMPFTAAAAVQSYDVPEGDASKTLQIYLEQSHIEMLYKTDAVRGVHTNRVHGVYEPTEALRLMLEGSGLSYEFTPDQSFATVKRPANTDTDQVQATRVSPRSPTSTTTSFTDAQLSEVYVTGTRLRDVNDAIAPTVARTSAEKRRTTYATSEDLLQTVTQATLGGPSELLDPGGNFGLGTGIDLRGFGASATLVLINGKRQAMSGSRLTFTDVSHIPWSVVDHVDVMPQGASAVYGSDAIAGVVNVVLRREIDGAQTQVRWGSGSNGADERLIAQLFGTEWGTGNLLAAYQYSSRSSLAATDRWYSRDSDKTAYGGSNFRSILSAPGNILDPLSGRPVFALPSGAEENTPNLENRESALQLLPEAQMHSGYFHIRQQLAAGVDLNAEALYSQRYIDQRHFAYDAVLPVPASNPFAVNPLNSPVILVGYSFADDLGPIESRGTTRYYTEALDLTIAMPRDWRARFSVGDGGEDLDVDVLNQVDFTELAAALADPDPATAFNPFGTAPHTNPQTIDRIRLDATERAISGLRTAGVSVDGQLASLPAGLIKLALGIERRKETLWRAGLANPPRFDREVTSKYAEALIPLWGRRDDPRATPRLSLSAAIRSDRYSDSDRNAVAPKFELQAVLDPSLKLRASWSDSYRAPSVIELFDQAQNNAAMLQLADGRWVLLTEGSNPNLRDEHANTYTAGFDLAPAAWPGLTLSLTYFRSNYYDRVTRLQPTTPLEQVVTNPQYAPLVEFSPSTEQVSSICHSSAFFGPPEQCELNPPIALIDARARNDAKTATDGIDLAGAYSMDTFFGHLGASIDGTYVLHFTQQITKTAPRVSVLDTAGYPLSKRFRTTLHWAQRSPTAPGFYASLTFERRNAYRDSDSPVLQDIRAWSTLDALLGWRASRSNGWGSDWEFTLNVSNLLNADPPFVNRELGFDVTNARPYGRVVSFTLSKSW